DLLFMLQGHHSRVTNYVFSPDGKLIISNSLSGPPQVWDVNTRELRYSLGDSWVSAENCAFTPDNKLIISASSDHTLKIWDTHTGECVANFFVDGNIYCCATDGDMIVAGGDRGFYFLQLVR